MIPPLQEPIPSARLHLLHNPIVRERLPGIATAFDETRMLGVLETALGEGAPRPPDITSCRRGPFMFLPETGCCNLAYDIEIRDPKTGQKRASSISARIFPTRDECESFFRSRLVPLALRASGRAELEPFPHPVGMIPSLRMTVSVYPIDGDLPTLLDATDEKKMLTVFRNTLEDGSNVHSCRVRVAKYRRRNRCVLRYDVVRGSQSSSVFGKVYQGECDFVPVAALEALRERAKEAEQEKIHLPSVLGASPEYRLTLLEAIPGKPRFARVLKKRLRGRTRRETKLTLEGAVDACARSASLLHRSGVAHGPRRTIHDELRALRRLLSFVEPISPELAEPLRHWYERLEVDAGASDTMPLCFSHGDFSYSQFLFDATIGGLVDFDTVCQAEPARDLGQFLAYLRIGFRKVGPEVPVSLCEWICSRFLDTYAEASGAPPESATRLRARVSLYQEATLLRIAMKSWQKLKMERLDHALAILRELDTRSAGLEPGSFLHAERENRRIVG